MANLQQYGWSYKGRRYQKPFDHRPSKAEMQAASQRQLAREGAAVAYNPDSGVAGLGRGQLLAQQANASKAAVSSALGQLVGGMRANLPAAFGGEEARQAARKATRVRLPNSGEMTTPEMAAKRAGGPGQTISPEETRQRALSSIPTSALARHAFNFLGPEPTGVISEDVTRGTPAEGLLFNQAEISHELNRRMQAVAHVGRTLSGSGAVTNPMFETPIRGVGSLQGLTNQINPADMAERAARGDPSGLLDIAFLAAPGIGGALGEAGGMALKTMMRGGEWTADRVVDAAIHLRAGGNAVRANAVMREALRHGITGEELGGALRKAVRRSVGESRVAAQEGPEIVGPTGKPAGRTAALKAVREGEHPPKGGGGLVDAQGRPIGAKPEAPTIETPRPRPGQPRPEGKPKLKSSKPAEKPKPETNITKWSGDGGEPGGQKPAAKGPTSPAQGMATPHAPGVETAPAAHTPGKGPATAAKPAGGGPEFSAGGEPKGGTTGKPAEGAYGGATQQHMGQRGVDVEAEAARTTHAANAEAAAKITTNQVMSAVKRTLSGSHTLNTPEALAADREAHSLAEHVAQHPGDTEALGTLHDVNAAIAKSRRAGGQLSESAKQEMPTDWGKPGDVVEAYAKAKTRGHKGKTNPEEAKQAAALGQEVATQDAEARAAEQGAEREFAAQAAREVAKPVKAPKLPTTAEGLRAHFAERKASGSLYKGPLASKQAGALRTGSKPIFTHEEVRAIWDHARKNYIDRGLKPAEVMRNTARDMGLTTDEVAHAMAQNKTISRLTDKMYLAQYKRRMAVRAAKRYVNEAGLSGFEKTYRAATNIPRGIAVFGHANPMVTHAGGEMFRPSDWGVWAKFEAAQLRAAWSPVFHERMMQEIERNADYALALRSGLRVGMDSMEDFAAYGHALSDTKPGKLYKPVGTVAEAGNRAMDTLKAFRMEMFSRELSKFPEEIRGDVAPQLAQYINHISGYGELGQAGKAMRETMFAPSLEASRWARMVGDPIKTAKTFAHWGSASPAERAMATYRLKRATQMAACYATALAANKALCLATGQEGPNLTNWGKSDFLKFRWGDHVLDPTGNMLAPIRYMGTVLRDLLSRGYEGDPKKDFVSDSILYAEGKAAPVWEIAGEAAFGQNAIGRKMPWKQQTGKQPNYTYGELTAEHAPIPVAGACQEIYRTLRESGADKSTAELILKGAATFAVEALGVKEGKPSKDVVPKSQRSRVRVRLAK